MQEIGEFISTLAKRSVHRYYYRSMLNDLEFTTSLIIVRTYLKGKSYVLEVLCSDEQIIMLISPGFSTNLFHRVVITLNGADIHKPICSDVFRLSVASPIYQTSKYDWGKENTSFVHCTWDREARYFSVKYGLTLPRRICIIITRNITVINYCNRYCS